jgi:hypothetical protein
MPQQTQESPLLATTCRNTWLCSLLGFIGRWALSSEDKGFRDLWSGMTAQKSQIRTIVLAVHARTQINCVLLATVLSDMFEDRCCATA